MRQSFAGFPNLPLPAPRVVLARERTFPALQKVLLTVAAGIKVVASLPAMNHGFWKVIAGGLANPNAANNGAAIDLLALSGLAAANVVGRARLTTDQNDNVPALASIGTNTPVLFELFFWPSVDDRMNSRGRSWGGLVSGFTGQTFAGTLGLPDSGFVTTADVVDGPIDLVILAVVGTTAAFTLDFLKVIEYPNAEDMWT